MTARHRLSPLHNTIVALGFTNVVIKVVGKRIALKETLMVEIQACPPTKLKDVRRILRIIA